VHVSTPRSALSRSAAIAVLAFALAAAGGAGASAPIPAGVAPQVPGAGRGVYLGAWVNPAGRGGELAQLGGFEQAIGRRLAILHFYTPFTTPLPLATLQALDAAGATPLLDWSCGASDAQIAAGDDDLTIYRYAQALAAYTKPVFLRWFWEMNLADRKHAHTACTGPDRGAERSGAQSAYIAAWQRIWMIFHGLIAPAGHTAVDASNVAFVWCPGVSNSDFAGWYPGNAYVDWIAADGYSPAPTHASFSDEFGQFYDWARHQAPDKPIMVAETGAGNSSTTAANGQIQAAYLSGAEQAIRGPMNDIQALVYFDAPGNTAGEDAWSLQGAGLHTFAQLAATFTYGQSIAVHIVPPKPTPPCGTACL
jgi:hypothetical protein